MVKQLTKKSVPARQVLEISTMNGKTKTVELHQAGCGDLFLNPHEAFKAVGLTNAESKNLVRDGKIAEDEFISASTAGLNSRSRLINYSAFIRLLRRSQNPKIKKNFAGLEVAAYPESAATASAISQLAIATLTFDSIHLRIGAYSPEIKMFYTEIATGNTMSVGLRYHIIDNKVVLEHTADIARRLGCIVSELYTSIWNWCRKPRRTNSIVKRPILIEGEHYVKVKGRAGRAGVRLTLDGLFYLVKTNDFQSLTGLHRFSFYHKILEESNV